MEDLSMRRNGRVVTLTINRPDRLNALTPDLTARLIQTLRDLEADNGVGTIVLTGAGKAFCAGGDVSAMASRPADISAEQVQRDLRQAMEVSRLLHECAKPTIAMVNGVAAGAGFSVALACDIRIAGASARFTTSFAKVGLPGDFGGSYFLARLVGAAKARELYFSSPVLDAQAAVALGIANEQVPDAGLAGHVAAYADRLAHGPTLAFAAMKASLNAAEHRPLADILDIEAAGMARCRMSEDYREGVRAFTEKRPPAFRGR